MIEKPFCKSVRPWLRGRLGRGALAPLTGQDGRALDAFVHAVALYGNSDAAGRRLALDAMRSLVLAMQPSTRHLAKASIPHVLDWSHEKEIWDAFGPDFQSVRVIEGPLSSAPRQERSA